MALAALVLGAVLAGERPWSWVKIFFAVLAGLIALSTYLPAPQQAIAGATAAAKRPTGSSPELSVPCVTKR